jgi:hypothetical protein
MKVEVGKSYRTRDGDVGVIEDWYDTPEYVVFVGRVRYADSAMHPIQGIKWRLSGQCFTSPRYDLEQEVKTPAPSTPPTTPSSLGEKPTNPKDMIATNKVPFHLWPETASAYGAMGFLDGALKYGRSNWRHAGVKASTYYDAARRHLNAWFEGEDNDPQSGVPHLGHALACIAILVDAIEAKKLNDDRMHPGGYTGLPQRFESLVAELRARHADKNPQHFTIMEAIAETPDMCAGTPSAVEELAKLLHPPLDGIRPGESLNDYYERLRLEVSLNK